MKLSVIGSFVLWVVLAISSPAMADTATYQIAASVDDAFCTSSTVSYNTSTTYCPYLGGGRRGFFRWACDIPAGSVITSAYIRLNSNITNTNTATAQLQLVDYDSCPDFSTNPYSYSVSGSTVNWSVPALTSASWYTSPDISDIVQEFIDRPGYSEGNYLGLRNVYVSHSGEWSSKVFRTWDYTGNALGAELVVNYTTTIPCGTLSYEYGTTNTTYHYRPLDITASYDGDTIWTMSVWTPEAGYSQTGHGYWRAGEISSFQDVDYGGTPFEYSPEADNATSSGLMKMSGMQGDFLDGTGLYDHSWQTADSYTFTKTYTIQTGVVGCLTVVIYPPLIFDDDWQTFIEGSYTIENNSGSAYNLWYTLDTAGTSSLSLEDGGYTTWSIVNPTTASAKPNSHVTDSTDGHQLYELHDWYGSTATGDLPGFYAKAAVADNGYTSANNMRPGLNFALRADAMDLYYSSLTSTMYGSTTVLSTRGVQMKAAQPGVFGSGASLPDGESITMNWQGIISTLETYLPPVANAGDDQVILDSDHSGTETVTLDGSLSADYDGSIVSYVWEEEGTQLATGQTPQVNLGWGIHDITLIVTDDDGEVGCDTVQVKINEYPAAYYLDTVNGSDSQAGTSAAPWLTLSHAQGLLEPGDTLYCTGDLGDVTLGAYDPVGTALSSITYARWAGQTAPSITTLTFDGIERDYYIVFEEFEFDPGYVTSDVMTLNLNGANYVTFDNCDLEGAKLLGASGDHAPYFPSAGIHPSVAFTGSPGNTSYITFSECRFTNACTYLYMAEYPTLYPAKQVRHWQILDCEFDGASDDSITLGGGNHTISGNYFHSNDTERGAYVWPGAATGSWPNDLSFAPLTQDTTGASGIFYKMDTSGGSDLIYILPDDDNYPVARNNAYVWRLDSNPTNVYFTPSGNGDNNHSDCIAIQGPVEDVLIERNWIEVPSFGTVDALKIAPSDLTAASRPSDLTIQNNVFTCAGTAPTYLIFFTGGDNILFRHNLIYAGPGAPLARGIRFLETTSFGAWDEDTIFFYNNIIGGALVDASTTNTATFDYNFWMQAPPAAITAGANDFIVAGVSAVGFVDETNMNFNLEYDSDCVDAGDPDEAPGVSAQHSEGIDYEGNDRDSSPDVGPYEYIE